MLSPMEIDFPPGAAHKSTIVSPFNGSNNLTNISNYIKISLDETSKIFKLMLKFNLIKL